MHRSAISISAAISYPFSIDFRHTRECGYPFFSVGYWIPAYAGMTESESPDQKMTSTEPDPLNFSIFSHR